MPLKNIRQACERNKYTAGKVSQVEDLKHKVDDSDILTAFHQYQFNTLATPSAGHYMRSLTIT